MRIPFSLGPIGRALNSRNYRIFITGSLVSLTGSWMQRITVGWVTWELTHSGFWLGIMAFADLFPTVVISPFAGAVVDRVNLMRLVKVTQALAIAQSAALAGLSLAGMLTVELLLGLVVFLGVVASFYQPARLSMIPQLVAREDLSAAVAVQAVVFNIARFIGPAVAGVMIAAAGAGWAFAANALTYAVFLLALHLVSLAAEDKSAVRAKGIGANIMEGYAYAFRHPGIGPTLLLMLVGCVLVRAVFELLPGFAGAVFQRDAEGLGMMAAATGFGAVVSGLWLGRRQGIAGLTRLSLANMILCSAFILGFAATSNFWLGLLFLAIGGVSLVLNGVSAQTLVQGAVDPAYRGRVMATYGMLQRSGPAIGALAMGAASEWVGLQWPLAVGCAISLAFGLWYWRHLDRMAAALEGPGRGGGAAA